MNTEKRILKLIARKKTIFFSQKKAEKELLSLLQKLTDEEKKSLKSDVRKLLRKYNKESFSVDSAHHKCKLACTAGFIMFSYSEYKSCWSIDYNKILNWYCPPWFDKYYNDNQFIRLGYDNMLEYTDRGCIAPSGSKVAQELVELKSDYTNFQNIILSKHIWTLFHYESGVYTAQEHPAHGRLEWKRKFVEFVKEKQIDRGKILVECLNTSTGGLNASTVYFFFDLFAELKPTNNELLTLQSELFAVFQSQYTQPIKQTIKYLKCIYKEPNFDITGFMEQISLLLIQNVKVVVNGALSLMDIAIKAHPKQKETLAILMIQALGQEDEGLQTRTLKLLSKHKLLQNKKVLDEIALYLDGLYSSVKALIPNCQEITIQEDDIAITPPQRIQEDNRIVYPESFDEMVFFFSGVLMSEEPYAVDLFLATLPKFYRLITNENVVKLEPIFHNAFKSCYPTNLAQTFRGSSGDIFAYYLAKYGLDLSTRFASAQYIEDMYIAARKAKPTNEFYIPKHPPLEKIKHDIQPNELSIIFHFMDIMLEKIKSGNTLELLSQVTHTPCYIDAESFKSRLDKYNELKIPIDTIDLQVALERTVDTEVAEVPDTLSFKVIEKTSKKAKRNITSLRIQSDMRRNNTTGMYHYLSIKKLGVMHKVDIQRLMTLVPSNIHLWLHSVIRTALTFSTFTDRKVVVFSASETGNRELVQNTLNILITIWNSQHPTNYLFVAASILFYDKISRQLASELWHKATLEGTMNHQLLGLTLGKLEHNAYAPLKRFTDLVVSNMLNLSTHHNQGLHTLLSAMIAQMNDEPIKGTKKLLEIYLEVLSLTGLDIPNKTIHKLEIWGEVKSLKSVVKSLSIG